MWQDLDESVHQEFCLRNGVNLIITDRPDVLRQTMDAYGACTCRQRMYMYVCVYVCMVRCVNVWMHVA